jgi:hypothetical protein
MWRKPPPFPHILREIDGWCVVGMKMQEQQRRAYLSAWENTDIEISDKNFRKLKNIMKLKNL